MQSNSMNPVSCLVMSAAITWISVIANMANLAAQETLVAGAEPQKWQGILDVRISQLTLNFDTRHGDDGIWTGEIYSVEQDNAKIPISKMEVDGQAVTIEARSVGATFKGMLSANGDRVTGKWKQGHGEYDFVIHRVTRFDEAKHIETWQGTLKAQGKTFEFGLRVFELASGSQWARLDSFSEGVEGIYADLTRDEKVFQFETKGIGGAFKGTFSDDRESIEGKWSQGGLSFPLKFSKTELDAKPARNRPQHPVEPFPYKLEKVQFKNSADRVSLAGTMTIPEGPGPWPAMVLISGSGPQDRDETILEHKPFLVIADHLTRNGIVVLRFDDRGTAESTGNFGTATSEDFSRDAEAAIAFLESRDDIRADQIGLIGHSEGGIIAPMVAARNDGVGMIVLLAGPGVDGATITVTQTRAMAAAAGTPAVLMDATDTFMKEILEHVTKSDKPIPTELIDSAFEKATAGFENAALRSLFEPAKSSLGLMESPWFRFFSRFDPVPNLKKVKCPVLALNGTKDLQVLADLNIDAIEKALTESGHTDFEVHKMENLNHMFQETDGPGMPGEYGNLEQTFSPKTLDLMTQWILKRTK